MKTRLVFLLAFLFLLQNNLSAQTWCPPGATWYFDYTYFAHHGYIKIEYTGNTVIDGITCNVLQKTFRERYHPEGTYTNGWLGEEYTYENAGIVYNYKYGQFYKLFDFNALPGEEWEVAGSNEFFPVSPPWGWGDPPTETHCDSTGIIKVDSIGTTIIDGQSLKYICVSLKSGSNWGVSGKVIEKIGPVKSYLFPNKYDYCGYWEYEQFYYAGKFRCYSDDNFSFNLLSSSVPTCDFIPTFIGIDEISKQHEIKYTCNNYDHSLSCFLPSELQTKKVALDIFSITGAKLHETIYSQGTAEIFVPLNETSAGIYILQLSSAEKTYRQKIVLD